jgi:hypothetical protein
MGHALFFKTAKSCGSDVEAKEGDEKSLWREIVSLSD